MSTTKMSIWTVSTIFCSIFLLSEAKTYSKRDASFNICDPVVITDVQCYCVKNVKNEKEIRSANCYLTNADVQVQDQIWESFNMLQNTPKIMFTNTRGISLKYIPRNAFKNSFNVAKVDVKYAQIEQIDAYAFSNISSVTEINLRNNQIRKLGTHAFANHERLNSLSLDENNLQEINRDVFSNLPALEKLFLTGNKLSTIHDRAFINIPSLLDLELDRNKLFSLNSETFSGLKNLRKLDLSINSLEVIGDNTFLPLLNLNSLLLDGNKIEVLDDKAFNGLSNLQSLSLAHNKLTNLNNANVFVGLNSLISLSLRGNQIRSIETEVISPILTNFYKATSSLDVEDNNFPCDCRLESLISIKNKTNNKQLQLALENLKCYPDPALREHWKKADEVEEVKAAEEENQGQSNDYEYYDDTQLDGKLFYTDVRDLLNCSSSKLRNYSKEVKLTNSFTETKEPIPLLTAISTIAEPSSIVTVPYPQPSTRKPSMTEYVPHRITNKGLLDLSLEDTLKTTNAPKVATDNYVSGDEKKPAYTTVKLATVSAKPSNKKSEYDDHDMASDEAVPDSVKTYRSIQDENDESNRESKSNNAFTFYSSTWLLILMIVRALYV